MVKPKVGRGNVAPYQTTHIRVPLVLKPRLEQIVSDYKDAVLSGVDHWQEYPPDVDRARELAAQVLKSKKSARVSLAKLLTNLYNVNIKPEDLGN